jgi:hypothetical protein
MDTIECGEVNVTFVMSARLARGLRVSFVDLFSELEQDADDLTDGK